MISNSESLSARFVWGTLAAIVLCVWAGADAPFFTRGEAREAIAAQEMFLSGNYILPEVYGGDMPSKPPFSHWVMNLVASAQGEFTEASARFSSLFFASCFLLIFFFFLRRSHGERVAWLSCFLLFSCLEWARALRTCRVDMTLAVCTVLGLLALFRWYEKDFRCARSSLIAIASLSAATLTKGPVGLVLPVGIFGLFVWLEKRSFVSAVSKSLLIFLPAGLLASLWYLLAYQQGGEKFLGKVLAENVTRFADVQRVMPHKHSAFYLYGTVLIGFFPWIIPACVALWSKFTNALFLQTVRELWTGSAFRRYALLATILPIIFYSIPSSKRSVYVLPIYPFLAFFLAEYLASLWNSEQRKFLRSLQAISLFCLLFSLGLLLGMGAGLLESQLPGFIKAESLNHNLNFFLSITSWESFLWSFLYGAVLLLAVFFSLRVWKAQYLGEAMQRLALSYTLLLAVVFIGIIPRAAQKLSAKEFLLAQSAHTQDSATLYSFGDSFFEGDFYLHKPFLSFERLSDKQREPILHAQVFSFSKNEAALREQFADHYAIERLATSPGYVWKPGRTLSLFELRKKDFP